jgi:hypothetical protein
MAGEPGIRPAAVVTDADWSDTVYNEKRFIHALDLLALMKAATERSTSSDVVAQEQTLIRIIRWQYKSFRSRRIPIAGVPSHFS